MQLEQVSRIIRRVGTEEVVSRFRMLTEDEVTEKGPGDLVTVADQECERVLAGELRAISDIPVVGEEATAADPALLGLVDSAEAVWVVDPIDGTANFVAGNARFAVMVALVEAGETTAAWVWHPDTDTMLTAGRGHGLERNFVPFEPAPSSGEPVGTIKRKYMPEPARVALRDFPPDVGSLVPGLRCAGLEYAALLAGEIDFLCYWRTLPWDHAPGSLLAAEAGLRVARLDGSPYRPGDDRRGLLAARPELWDRVADTVTAALASA